MKQMERQALDLIKTQIEEVQVQYPDFELVLLESGEPEATGTLSFKIEHDGHQVRDVFSVRLRFPADYNASPPYIWETEKRIPPEFGHFMKAGNLCLGAPVELKRKFSAHQNLRTFLNEQVVPYLFSYSYKRDYGVTPFGELNHGYFGLLPYYQEQFEAALVPTLKLLKSLADNFVPPQGCCVCGSGLSFRQCHGRQLTELLTYHSPREFETELRGMIKALRAPEVVEMLAECQIAIPMRAITPKRILRRSDRSRH